MAILNLDFDFESGKIKKEDTKISYSGAVEKMTEFLEKASKARDCFYKMPDIGISEEIDIKSEIEKFMGGLNEK